MFDSLFSTVREGTRQFTVYSDEATDVERLFPNQNVSIAHRTVPVDGPEPFLVLEGNGEFAGAIALADLEALLEPPLVRPGERDGVSSGYRVLFELLENQAFTTMERTQLLAVSREIEDRAFRVGTGELRVSFQTRPSLDSQTDVYRHLAAETDLDIHIYGVAGWNLPPIPDVTYHEYDTETLGRYWVLAFDGGAEPSQTCALVAEEQPDGYEGFWTDDPEMVDQILDILRSV